VLINFGPPGGIDVAPWAGRVRVVAARYAGPWELPALGAVTPPAAVLVRPDGYVCWVGCVSQPGLAEALTRWFGPPSV
jgi:3-(3-hydroxy-phenyl)propionate hydroxylase